MSVMRGLLIALGLLLLAPAAVRAQAPSPELEQLLDEVGKKLDSGDTAGAVDAAERAVELRPASSAAQLWLGRAYGQKALEASVFTKVGPARRCREAFEKAIELDPSNVDARGHLVEFYVQAPGFLGGGVEKARGQADAMLALAPVRGHLAWASIHRDQKDSVKAEAEYRAAAEADAPGAFDGHYALTAFYLDAKRFDDARPVWLAVLKLRPDDPIARYQLAKVSVFSGTHLEEALQHLQAYLAAEPPPRGPSGVDARWRLALVYEKLGRRAEAQDALREALRLQPDHAFAQKDLKRLSTGGTGG